MARASIESAGVQNRLAGGVILTGGGALLPGATELAQQIFDLPVRLGKPIELSGWSDKVDTPQFATGVGLLRFALRQPGTLGNPLATSANPQLAPAMADPARRVWGRASTINTKRPCRPCTAASGGSVVRVLLLRVRVLKTATVWERGQPHTRTME
jgi:cell division ATPase FtsA